MHSTLNAGGGTLVYGIADDGVIEDLQQEGLLIFLFHVEPDYERLFSLKDNEAIYLRVADSNRGPLKRDEVKKLEYNKTVHRHLPGNACLIFRKKYSVSLKP